MHSSSFPHPLLFFWSSTVARSNRAPSFPHSQQQYFCFPFWLLPVPRTAAAEARQGSPELAEKYQQIKEGKSSLFPFLIPFAAAATVVAIVFSSFQNYSSLFFSFQHPQISKGKAINDYWRSSERAVARVHRSYPRPLTRRRKVLLLFSFF